MLVFATCSAEDVHTGLGFVRSECPRAPTKKFDAKWLVSIGLSEQDAAKFKISFLEKALPSEQMDEKKLSAVTTLVSQLLNGHINIDNSVLDGLKEGTASCPANDCVFGLLEAAP